MKTKSNEVHQSVLIRLYDDQPFAADKLPYSPEFDSIVSDFQRLCDSEFDHRFTWLMMVHMRKSSLLPKKGRESTRAERLQVPEPFLISLYDGQPMVLDNLPYCDRYDKLVADFQAKHGNEFGHRPIWLKLVQLRKSGSLPRKGRSSGKGKTLFDQDGEDW